MPHFDAASAECLVFTRKEGFLSAVAHDLKIRVTKFTIDVDETARRVEARFDATSLRVVCAMQGDAESRGTLTRDNQREIERDIVREVLHAETYPEIRFRSSVVEEAGEQYLIGGRLALHGHDRQIRVTVRREAERYVAAATVHQPDFGIRPYTALLGALRVAPDVALRVIVPAPAP